MNSRHRIAIVTNGTDKKGSIKLAQIAGDRKIRASLSIDEFHDPIDPEVIKAFVVDKENYAFVPTTFDFRTINCCAAVLSSGRAVETGVANYSGQACVCAMAHVLPNGNVRACGCQDAPIYGHISALSKIATAYVDGCFWGKRATHVYDKIHNDIAENILNKTLTEIGLTRG